MKSQIVLSELKSFFCALEGTPVRSLERFFGTLQSVLPVQTPVVGRAAVELDGIDCILKRVSEHLVNSASAGELLNVWTVARLGRDERRNAAVLYWLLDRRGSHGQGDRFLVGFLDRLSSQLPDNFPRREQLCPAYRTSIETYPFGMEDRVDIEIEGSNFLVFIEVKIDAVEGPDQLPRYVRLAERKANGRPYCVAFLHPRRRDDCSLMPYLIPATWHDVASCIDDFLRGDSSAAIGDHLRKSLHNFATHTMRL